MGIATNLTFEKKNYDFLYDKKNAGQGRRLGHHLYNPHEITNVFYTIILNNVLWGTVVCKKTRRYNDVKEMFMRNIVDG